MNELESQGLVQRRPHATDGRVKLVDATRRDATRKGKALARRADTILAPPGNPERALSPRDLATLHRILAAVAAPE